MAQHDFDVANGSGATVRSDINDALEALVTNSAGATAPSVTFPNQFWYDSTASQLKVRNPANTNWVTLADFASSEFQLVNSALANMAQSTLKGRAAGAGTGDPTDLTAAQVNTLLGLSFPFDFRLSLETGVPVSTTDQTAKTTLYCTPYIGNKIALYDGTNWNIRSSAEFSISLAGLTANTLYDVWVYDNAGTPTLELLAWSTLTARATALVRQDGILSKTGALTRRYAGTVATTGTIGQTQLLLGSTAAGGGPAWVGLWNMYNRVNIVPKVKDSTATHNYTSATVRSYNNSTNNRISMVRGLNEDGVNALFVTHVLPSVSGQAYTGIGLDTTTSTDGTGVVQQQFVGVAIPAPYAGLPGLGFHFLQCVQASDGTNPNTFFGTPYFNFSANMRY